MTNDTLPFRARQALDLTTTEAGQLVYVTRRTWEMWESGQVTMPAAKRELFITKLEGWRSENRELVVVFADDGLTPVDVVARDNFCSIKMVEDGIYVISSLAVRRDDRKPYVHRQRFRLEHNKHIHDKTNNWKSVMEQ